MEHIVFQWLCRPTPLLDTVHPGIEISTTLFAMKLMTTNVQCDWMSLLGNAFDPSPEAGFDSFFQATAYRPLGFFLIDKFKVSRP